MVNNCKVMSAKSIWNNSPIESRKRLLKTMGYNDMDFAKIKFQDLTKRSGGMVKNDIERLVKIRNSNLRKKCQ